MRGQGKKKVGDFRGTGRVMRKRYRQRTQSWKGSSRSTRRTKTLKRRDGIGPGNQAKKGKAKARARS